jgi:hypothetical protein
MRIVMAAIKNIRFELGRARQNAMHILRPWIGLFRSPIVIYSMGKVGSTSVQASLEKLHLPNPIFHIHFMDWEYLDEVDAYTRTLGIGSAGFVLAGRYLRAFADRTWGRVKWKIITLVREPVGREVSDLFQNLQRFPDLKNLSGNELVDGAVGYMQNLLEEFDESEDYTCNWFDRELKKVFGVDVYEIPFDRAQGYSHYYSQNADVLLIRLEDLSKIGPEVICHFLGLKNFELVNANEGSGKVFYQIYQRVLEKLAYPSAILDKVYNSRYSRHFYSDLEIVSFKKRWCQNK